MTFSGDDRPLPEARPKDATRHDMVQFVVSEHSPKAPKSPRGCVLSSYR